VSTGGFGTIVERNCLMKRTLTNSKNPRGGRRKERQKETREKKDLWKYDNGGEEREGS